MLAGLPTDTVKRDLDDYVHSAIDLFRSMADRGYDPAFPIPIDVNRELLGGAHRLACALVLGYNVPVVQENCFAHAPPWGREWFEGLAEFDRLEREFWAELK